MAARRAESSKTAALLSTASGPIKSANGDRHADVPRPLRTRWLEPEWTSAPTGLMESASRSQDRSSGGGPPVSSRLRSGSDPDKTFLGLGSPSVQELRRRRPPGLIFGAIFCIRYGDPFFAAFEGMTGDKRWRPGGSAAGTPQAREHLTVLGGRADPAEPGDRGDQRAEPAQHRCANGTRRLHGRQRREVARRADREADAGGRPDSPRCEGCRSDVTGVTM